jgi:hypothetical protein
MWCNLGEKNLIIDLEEYGAIWERKFLCLIEKNMVPFGREKFLCLI